MKHDMQHIKLGIIPFTNYFLPAASKLADDTRIDLNMNIGTDWYLDLSSQIETDFGGYKLAR